MDGTDPAYVDAADRTLSLAEAEADLAYAEVGGVHRVSTSGVLTETGTRSISQAADTGVWCRPFVDGAADYRYTTELDHESIADMVGRVTRAARHLAQERPASVDESTHRATHPGWAETPATDRSTAEKQTALAHAIEPARADDRVRRVRLEYADAHEDVAFLTTGGTTLQLVRDRASIDLVIQPVGGPKVRRFFGTADPERFWTGVDSAVRDALADARRLAGTRERNTADAVGSDVSAVLSPLAAGQLVHRYAHAFEADAHLMGLSPYALGDRIAPDRLTIRDAIVDGNWGSIAYDAEGRPTTPTTLVRDGRLVSLLHDTATAVDADAWPVGSSIPSLGHEHAPRIHARHLDVAAGGVAASDLLDDAAIAIDRFGPPRFVDAVEETAREGWMPASSLYALEIATHAPDPTDPGAYRLPIEEGTRVADGERAAVVTDRVLHVDPDTLRRIDGIATSRETVTGICRKHGSELPYAVTTPAIRLSGRVERA